MTLAFQVVDQNQQKEDTVDYENGLKHGYGVYTWIDGTQYDGLW